MAGTPHRERETPGRAVRAVRAATYPLRVITRIYRFVRTAARVLGWLGILLLAACWLLAVTPDQGWPGWLDPTHLPIYVSLSLVLACMLGWAFVEEGQEHIERAVGAVVSVALFVVLPVACAALGVLASNPFGIGWGPPPTHWVHPLARWYGPSLVVVSLVVFLRRKSRAGRARGVWFGLLVAPYVALFAWLVLGVRVGGLDEAHEATVHSLGAWAIALQLALAFFVGGPR
jgi:hypothetical protein